MSFFTRERRTIVLAAAAAVFFQAGKSLAAPKEAGVWYDDTGKGAVKIEACGNKLCGRIYWLKDQLNAEGKPLRDKHNPNEGQRNRPICGLQVIGGLTLMQSGEWDSGWIYDPKEGKSYSVALVMPDPNTLKVTGYLVMKMMGRTLTWTRAPDDLPACAQNAAAASPAATAPAAKPKPSKVAAPLPPEEDTATTPVPEAPPAAQAVPAAKAEMPKPAAKAAAKPTAKAGEAAAAPKNTAKPAAAKTGTKTTAEVLPWAKDNKAPATGSAVTGASTVEPAAPMVKAARPQTPDMQATFGAQ